MAEKASRRCTRARRRSSWPSGSRRTTTSGENIRGTARASRASSGGGTRSPRGIGPRRASIVVARERPKEPRPRRGTQDADVPRHRGSQRHGRSGPSRRKGGPGRDAGAGRSSTPRADLETATTSSSSVALHDDNLGFHFMGEVPFRRARLSGLIVDEPGDKMSKEAGNRDRPARSRERRDLHRDQRVAKTTPGAPQAEAQEGSPGRENCAVMAMGQIGLHASCGDAVAVHAGDLPKRANKCICAGRRASASRGTVTFLNKRSGTRRASRSTCTGDWTAANDRAAKGLLQPVDPLALRESAYRRRTPGLDASGQ